MTRRSTALAAAVALAAGTLSLTGAATAAPTRSADSAAVAVEVATAGTDSPLGEVFARNADRILAVTQTTMTAPEGSHESGPKADRESGARSLSAPPVSFQRLGWTNRYETAVQISQAAFLQPELTFGGVVFVANGLNFPDALAAGPVAATMGGPILLVPPTGGLPAAVRDEVRRLEPADIVILGKSDNVSAQAEQELAALITDPEGGVYRVAGDNRYKTSALLSFDVLKWRNYYAEPTTAIITSGRTYADALAGGMAGAWEGAPLLLADGQRLDPWVAEALAPLEVEEGYMREFTTVRILGSPATVSTAIETEIRAILPGARVVRYAGADRFDTAALLNADAYEGILKGQGHPVVITNGHRFPDALAGASLSRRGDTRMVLSRTDCLPDPSAGTISTYEPYLLVALGMTDAVSDQVLFQQQRCA